MGKGGALLHYWFIECIKRIYLVFYKMIYNVLSIFIRNTKTDGVIIANHYNNTVNFLTQHPSKMYVVITSNGRLQQKIKSMNNVTRYFRFNLFTTIRQIIAILQTKTIVIDDYYAPLYIIGSNKKVINIWHAYAVYKKIALDAPYYNNRNRHSISRFKKNYQRIDEMLVRSEIEKDIFIKSYQMSPDKVFIDEALYKTTLPSAAFQKKREKVVLYAPTHRPYSYNYDKIVEWLEEQYPEYTVYVTYHQLTVKKHHRDIVDSVHRNVTLNKGISNAEIFITDYSSLLLEVNDLCSTIETYQLIDASDWERYMKLYGLNDMYYNQDIKKINMSE